MSKMYGVSPSVHYMGIVRPTYLIVAVDFACSTAYWTDENTQYEKSKEHAKHESLDIEKELKRYKQQLSER